MAQETLTAKLAQVTERLEAGAPNTERPGADLIAWYLSPDRRREPWSRKHTDTQRRLCTRFTAPVIGATACQDIRVADMQQIVSTQGPQATADHLPARHPTGLPVGREVRARIVQVSAEQREGSNPWG